MERSTRPSELGNNPGLGLGGRAHRQNRAWQLESKEGTRGLSKRPLIHSELAALRATGVEVQPLQTVMFPGTKTVVIPPHEQWMDSLPNYAGNETVAQRKAGTLLD